MTLFEYFGRFHPLLVHLPIGILFLIATLAIIISREQLSGSKSLLRTIFLISAVSSTFSTITGLVLLGSGSYDGNLAIVHQILGIILTILNWLMFFLVDFLMNCHINFYRGVWIILLLILGLTGHAGGSLTHGEDFLTLPPANQWLSGSNENDADFTLESSAYAVTAQIFETKCVVCHGKNKQKGKLRLDIKDGILAGGKNGDLLAKDIQKSLLIQRLVLPMDDDDHMPPKEKKQLTEQEIDFLKWWIGSGADFEKSLIDLSFPDSLHTLLRPQTDDASPNPMVPQEEVKDASNEQIEKLRKMGVVIIRIGQSSSYLSANFVNVPNDKTDLAVAELTKISKQLIWLNLDYQILSEESWKHIAALWNLRKLSLKNSNITDQDLNNLKEMKQLASLNLVSTNISLVGVNELELNHSLNKLSLFGVPMAKSDYQKIKSLFPNAEIDTGNYMVPTYASDTTILTKENAN